MQAADQACLLDVRPIDVHEVQNRTEYFLRCTDSVAQFGSHCSFPTFSYILPLDATKRPGLWLRGLSSRFSHVIGLDQSQKLLEKAWRRFTCCSATKVASCKFNLNKCCVCRVLGVDFEMSAGRESIRITTCSTTQRGASTCGGFGQTLRKGTWSPRWGATPLFWGWQMLAQKLWILDTSCLNLLMRCWQLLATSNS